MILCPECENELDIDEDTLDEGETVSCVECSSEFEVVSVDPLELSKITDEDDDDDDDDDDTVAKKDDDDDDDDEDDE
jgi:alpha-aminoadipate carrier protein LysW